MDEDWTGKLLDGRYRVTRFVGRGGMGVVYEAIHEQLGKPVAVKLLHGHLAVVGEVLVRFQREAKAAGSLQHSNIVRVDDFVRIPGDVTFLVMERLVGRSAQAALDEDGPMTPGRVALIASQTLAGLGAAHSSGIVHRDLKPDNVFLEDGPGGAIRAKVLDFGIAKLWGADTGIQLTVTGAVLGTPAFMSPEQALGREVDARTDIYAVGAMMHSLLTGRHPFEAQTLPALITAVATEPPARIPGVDPSLMNIIERAMEKKSDDRFLDADEMREALDGFMRGRAPSMRPPPRHTQPIPLSVRPSAPFTQPAPRAPAPSDETVTIPRPGGGRVLAIGVGVGLLAGAIVAAAIFASGSGEADGDESDHDEIAELEPPTGTAPVPVPVPQRTDAGSGSGEPVPDVVTHARMVERTTPEQPVETSMSTEASTNGETSMRTAEPSMEGATMIRNPYDEPGARPAARFAGVSNERGTSAAHRSEARRRTGAVGRCFDRHSAEPGLEVRADVEVGATGTAWVTDRSQPSLPAPLWGCIETALSLGWSQPDGPIASFRASYQRPF